jgi:hypothetical protein
LDSNGALRREAMRRAVDVTPEGHTLIVYLAGLCQRENLKAARIGQHGTGPAHEPVQATQAGHHIVTGTQIEVVCIREHECSAQFFDLCGRERFDRRLRANRGKDGSEQVAVRRGEDSRAGAIVFSCDAELEHEGDYNGRGWGVENLGTKSACTYFCYGQINIVKIMDEDSNQMI